MDDMQQASQEATRTRRLFWMGVLLHFVVWLVLPLLTRPNYPLDVVECFLYGQDWALASGKHPPLPSWTVYAISCLTGHSKAAPYLASQIFIFSAVLSVWLLASEILSPRKALLAVGVMEWYSYFTLYGLEFNNSLSLIGCWAPAVLLFYYAVQKGKLRYWIATGLFLGLGVLAKYTGFLLVLILLAFMVYEPKTRRFWKTPGPYLTTLIAFLAFLPHFIVVCQSDFSTLDYAADRIDMDTYRVSDHLIFPLWFCLKQLGVTAPILLSVFYFCGGRIRRRTWPENEGFAARFLVFLIFVPLVFQLAISALFGIFLGTIYGSHLWIFLGVFCVFFLEIDSKKLSSARIVALFAIAMSTMICVTVVRDVASPYWRHKPSRIHYPGSEIAREVERLWHERYSRPLPHLVGEWWLSGMVAAYGNDRAKVFCYAHPDLYEKNSVLSIWSSPEDAAREGGICLWDEKHYSEKVPPLLLEEYPNAEILPTMTLPYSTGAEMPSLRLGLAIIPPQEVVEPSDDRR